MAITNSKQAANFLNKRAPEGESLAFINEGEARLLKANGGSGLPLPTAGNIPSYFDWGKAWDTAKNWAVKTVKDVDLGEWVDMGTKAWDTYANYKDNTRKNEEANVAYDKYVTEKKDYGIAADLAVAENLTPMTVANAPLTKSDITKFQLVAKGGIIGLKNGGRPGYMMGEGPVMAGTDAEIDNAYGEGSSENAMNQAMIPPEMQAISQQLFSKAVEELTEQEIQMLMAYMQKMAVESDMGDEVAQAPMEEEMMVSETMMAANGGIMNNKRGLVDGPGGYAGMLASPPYGDDLPEPRGNPGIVEPIAEPFYAREELDPNEVDLGNPRSDDRIVPEEFGLEPEMYSTEIFEDGGDMSILEQTSKSESPLTIVDGRSVTKEHAILIEGGIELEKQLMEIFNAFTQRFPGIEDYENETFTDMIAMLQAEGVFEASNQKLAALSQGLQGITPASIERTKQRIARGDTQFGSLSDMPIGVEMNSGGGPGIEALRKVRPDVVETMGFNMGGRAMYAGGGRAMYAYGQGPVMNQGIGSVMANDGMEMLDMGGMEKDYRFDGGFVPMGEYEKKDDVPARLSKNEFVFTADAVRAAGGGSIQKGAKKMYDTMKNLEAKV